MTTLCCEFRHSALVSELTVGAMLRSLSGLLKGAVEVDESERNDVCVVGL